MKKRIEEQININSPKQEVFNFISDLLNYPKWNNALNSKLISGDGKINSKYEITIPTFLSKKNVNLEVIKYSYPDTFSYKDLSLFFPNETGFIISGENETNLTLFKEGDLSLLSSGYVNSKTKNEILEMLNKIKKLLEETSNTDNKTTDTSLTDSTKENSEEKIIINSPFDDTPEEIKRKYIKSNY